MFFCVRLIKAKSIKKLLKILSFKITLLAVLALLVFFAIRNSRVQNYVAIQLTDFLGNTLQTDFTIGSASYNIFKKLNFHDVLIKDLQGDTLLYTNKLSINWKRLNRKKRELTIKRISFDNAYINFYLPSDSAPINLQFIIDHIENNKDTSKTKLTMNIKKIDFNNSVFRFRDMSKPTDSDKLTPSDMYFREFNVSIRDFKKASDTISMHISDLSFTDHSGFHLEKMESDFSVHKTFMKFNDLYIKTRYSDINSSHFYLTFENFQSIGKGRFPYAAIFNARLNKSRLLISDLGYFAPALKQLKNYITLETSITNSINNLKLSNTRLAFGELSEIAGNFEFNGLPDTKNTFMFFDINHLVTHADDIAGISIGNKTPKIPQMLHNLDTITYKGKFTGFPGDFVTYGKFGSSLGNISTDILLRPDTLKNVYYKGNIKAKNFMAGKLLSKNNDIGRTSFNMQVEGTNFRNNSFRSNTKGTFDYIEYRNYPVKDISLNGLLTEKRFNGELTINDSNLDFNFNGEIDFTQEIRKYKFNAQVNHANLSKLNIVKSDPNYTISFIIKANATGNAFNNVNGEVNILNAFFSNTQGQLQLYDIALTAFNRADSNYLGINSEIIDGNMTGNFMLDKFNQSVYRFIQRYLPSVNGSRKYQKHSFHGNFKLDVELKNIRPVVEYFAPEYSVANNSKISMQFTDSDKPFNMLLQSNEITYKKYRCKNLYINALANDSALTIETGCERLTLNEQIHLENFTLLSSIQNDSIALTNRWHNWDTLVSRGNIQAWLLLDKNPGNKLRYALNVAPSEMVFSDSLWNINHSSFIIDTNKIRINHFSLEHNNQKIVANGLLNKNTSDSISLHFQHYNLSNINHLLGKNQNLLQGKLNGYAVLTHINKVPNLFTELNINNLVVNKQEFGNAELNTIWNDKDNSLNLNANIFKGRLNTINILGKYQPFNGHAITASITFNKLRLSVLNPYISSIFSDLRGLLSGRISVGGSLQQPLLNGHLNMLKTSFIVNFLNTRYSFSDKIDLSNNKILFNNIEIFDTDGNTAYLNGAINNEYLKNFNLDLNIETNNFLCINTTYSNNPLYYGTAYSTGLIEINGPTNKLALNITARTDPKTVFNIPLQDNANVHEYNFISFNTKKQEEKPIFIRNEAASEANLNMNFDLQVTPDAEIQIIFDSKVGDIIKSRGEGNINMQINTQGKFNMYGEYNISEEGTYLFTLKNIINKKFTVKPGSSITWKGDPAKADIDMIAVYHTKTSLAPLFNTEEESAIYDRSTRVNCLLKMTGNLNQPDIQTGLEFPNVDVTARSDIERQLDFNDTEEINKQFLALLTINAFLPEGKYNFDRAGRSSGISTTTELLSNQLSNWLSQFSKQFDFGIDYNYQDPESDASDEIALNVSTQLWNNRVNINVAGNYSNNSQTQENTNIGDFEVDVKLNKSGKLRFKAFNQSEDDYSDQNLNDRTQGIGFFYQEEFNSISDLFDNYRRKQKKNPYVGKNEEPKE